MGKPTRAFTLVELLVVISMVGILMMLLSPVLRYAREAARITRCSHNLTEIHHALFLYADDRRGIFPPATVLNSPPSYWRQLHHLLVEYVGDGSRVFHCPSDQGYHAWYGGSVYFPYFGSSYQTRGDDKNFNHWLAQGRVEPPYYAFGGEQADYYGRPSELGIIRDGCGWHFLGYDAGRGTVKGSRAQCLFLDGHVEYFSRHRPWPPMARIW